MATQLSSNSVATACGLELQVRVRISASWTLLAGLSPRPSFSLWPHQLELKEDLGMTTTVTGSIFSLITQSKSYLASPHTIVKLFPKSYS